MVLTRCWAKGVHHRLRLTQTLPAAEVLKDGALEDGVDGQTDLNRQVGDVRPDVHNGAVGHDAKQPRGLGQLSVVLAGKCNLGVVKGNFGHIRSLTRPASAENTLRGRAKIYRTQKAKVPAEAMVDEQVSIPPS